MKNLRQELIDFMRWKVGSSTYDYLRHHLEGDIDTYIKSINSAQSEALSVGNNEQAKEFIGCTCSEDEKHGETSIMCCNHCGKPTESFWVHQ